MANDANPSKEDDMEEDTASDNLGYEKEEWDAMESKIKDLVNEVTTENLGATATELCKLKMNIGRGIFCKACTKRQTDDPDSSDLMAGLVAAINVKFPEVGNLLCKRVLIQFLKALKAKNRDMLFSAAKFMSPLLNLSVLGEITTTRVMIRALSDYSDDNVEVSVMLMKECGWAFFIISPGHADLALDKLKEIYEKEDDLSEGVRLMVEDLLEATRKKFGCLKLIRGIPDELVIVEEGTQITHDSFGDGPDLEDTEEYLDSFETHPLKQNGKLKEAFDRPITIADDANPSKQYNLEEDTAREDLEYEKAEWDVMERKIEDLVNGITVTNLETTAAELCKLKMNMGQGIFCKVCMQRQIDNPESSDLIAALVAAVNVKFPDAGGLLCKRVLIQFLKALKGRDRDMLFSAAKFMSPLLNLCVLGEMITMHMVLRAVLDFSEDNVEVSVKLMEECGWAFFISAPGYADLVFHILRAILTEKNLSKRVKVMVGDFIKATKTLIDGLKLRREVPDELEIVDVDDQITHDSFGMGPDLDDTDEYLDSFETYPLKQNGKLKQAFIGEDDIESAFRDMNIEDSAEK